jgi:hypothetical protein
MLLSVIGFRLNPPLIPELVVPMKQLLLPIASIACLFAPLQQATAKTFGGFSAGQKITMKVVTVTSTKRIGYFGTETKAPIQNPIPKFKKGQSVTFTVGKKGELDVSGKFSVPFAHASKTQNEYNYYKAGATAINRNIEIIKAAGNKPKSAIMSFFITKTGGVEPVFTSVVYGLK